MTTTQTNIARRYYDYRKARGPYSMRQLAEDALVSVGAVETWCSGKQQPSRNMVARIEAAIRSYERAESRRLKTKVRMTR